MDHRPTVTRDVHLFGGVHAISVPRSPEIIVFPNTIDGKKAVFQIPTYARLYESLREIGLTNLVGTEFYTCLEQLDGRSPSEWRTQSRYKSIAWSHCEAIRHWSAIANQGYQLKNAYLWDIAKRISHQINSLNESFRRLSFAYRKQLLARTKTENIVLKNKFQDGFSKNIYDLFQHFLFDASTLRDYLSEFIFHFILPADEKGDFKHMSTTSRIFKTFFKEKEQNTEFRKYYSNICNSGGWLNTLGLYRDLVVHACPMSMASGRISLSMGTVCLSGSKIIPTIIAPIPANPSQIALNRSSLTAFEDFQKTLGEFFEQANNTKSSLDILSYAKFIMDNFSDFIWKLADETDYKGIEFALTDKDIVSEIKIRKT